MIYYLTFVVYVFARHFAIIIADKNTFKIQNSHCCIISSNPFWSYSISQKFICEKKNYAFAFYVYSRYHERIFLFQSGRISLTNFGR